MLAACPPSPLVYPIFCPTAAAAAAAPAVVGGWWCWYWTGLAVEASGAGKSDQGLGGRPSGTSGRKGKGTAPAFQLQAA
eukprot:1144297-Pelagomonas_calceolata.AAC.3